MKLDKSTNLVDLNYENLKHVTFLKNVDQKIQIEAGKNEL